MQTNHIVFRPKQAPSLVVFTIGEFERLAGGNAGHEAVDPIYSNRAYHCAKRRNIVSKAEFDRLAKLELELREQLGYFSAADRMSRDEIYDRDR